MLLELPFDSLVEILTYCNTADAFQILRVNKKFLEWRNVDKLWERLILQKYNVYTPRLAPGLYKSKSQLSRSGTLCI